MIIMPPKKFTDVDVEGMQKKWETQFTAQFQMIFQEQQEAYNNLKIREEKEKLKKQDMLI